MCCVGRSKDARLDFEEASGLRYARYWLIVEHQEFDTEDVGEGGEG
jgi:hypothetical protein